MKMREEESSAVSQSGSALHGAPSEAEPSGPLSPGQHLQAISAAFFRGGGWAEAPEWVNYDGTGHAAWERFAGVIGRNMRAAVVATELLEALSDLVGLVRQVAPAYAESTVVANAEAAIAKAEGRS